ncbi:hypothetical protein HK096_002020, partial [Nowakowskiella sp. JEL0078]
MASNRKPCKQEGVHHVLTMLGNPATPKLYFVVPIDQFQSFQYQKYEDAQGMIFDAPTYGNVIAVN